jgi:hypothetical protein
MTDTPETALRPGSPAEFGVTMPELPTEKVEPARLLANDARPRLRRAGLTDEHIDDWADAFFADHPEGGNDELIAWIADQQGGAG